MKEPLILVFAPFPAVPTAFAAKTDYPGNVDIDADVAGTNGRYAQ